MDETKTVSFAIGEISMLRMDFVAVAILLEDMAMIYHFNLHL